MLLSIIDTVTGWIGTIIYPLFSIIFVLVDLIQDLFYAFAGISSLSYNGTVVSGSGDSLSNLGDGGIVYYLLNSSLVKNMFMSLSYLALVLLVVFMAISAFRNIYAEKPKRWQDIFMNAIKGLATYFLVPVTTLLGIWVANILLRAVNDATTTTGNATMSRQLFISAAYNANRIRQDGSIDYDTYLEITQLCVSYNVSYDSSGTYSLSEGETNKDSVVVEYWASIVDEIYGNTSISIYGYAVVSSHYDLCSINYVLLLAGGLFMMYALYGMAYAMIKRMINIIILYIVSPVVCSMYPFDDGKVAGQWRSQMVKEILTVYGSVVAMNLFLSILPLLQNITFVSDASTGWAAFMAAGLEGWINQIMSIVLTTCGLLTIKEWSQTFSQWVGGGDAYSTGTAFRNSVRSTIGDKTKKYVAPAAKAAGSFAFKSARTIRTTAQMSSLNKQLKGMSDTDPKRAELEEQAALKKSELSAQRKDLGMGVAKGLGRIGASAVNYGTAGAVDPMGVQKFFSKDGDMRKGLAETDEKARNKTKEDRAKKKTEAEIDAKGQEMLDYVAKGQANNIDGHDASLPMPTILDQQAFLNGADPELLKEATEQYYKRMGGTPEKGKANAEYIDRVKTAGEKQNAAVNKRNEEIRARDALIGAGGAESGQMGRAELEFFQENGLTNLTDLNSVLDRLIAQMGLSPSTANNLKQEYGRAMGVYQQYLAHDKKANELTETAKAMGEEFMKAVEQAKIHVTSDSTDSAHDSKAFVDAMYNEAQRQKVDIEGGTVGIDLGSTAGIGKAVADAVAENNERTNGITKEISNKADEIVNLLKERKKKEEENKDKK